MNLIKNIQNKLDNILDIFGNYYISVALILHVLYFLALIGILSFDITLLRGFNIFIQLFICLFLMIRFHPFRKHELREYDSKIIFSSAAFLLLNLGVIEIVTQFGTVFLQKIYKIRNSIDDGVNHN
jgi:hypothetical protein